MAMVASAAARSHPAAGVNFALPSDLIPICVAHPAAAASFRSLAAVELQLVMRCCDKRTLLALARCCRSTLLAASDPFTWRRLPPLKLAFVHQDEQTAQKLAELPQAGAWQWLRSWIRPPPPPPQPLSAAHRLSASLLRFCDIKVNWTHDHVRHCSVTDAELDALAAIPRLTALDSSGHFSAGPAHVASLVSQPGLRNLTALVCDGRQLDETSVAALSVFCPRLSTVTRTGFSHIDPPLHLLPALTDLSARLRHSDGLTVGGVLRCAGLRRLTIWPDLKDLYTSRDVHTALLSPNLPALEHLSVHGIDAFHADGRRQPPARLDWAAAFAQLPALRSLHLEEPRGIDELLAAISAGCAQLLSLRVHSSHVDFDEPIGAGAAFPSAAVVSALLARRPSLHTVALFLPTRDRFVAARSPMDYHTRERVWMRAHGDLNVIAALHHQRLSVCFCMN